MNKNNCQALRHPWILGGKRYINLTFVWFMHLVFNTPGRLVTTVSFLRNTPLSLSPCLCASVRAQTASVRLSAAAPSLHSPEHFTTAFRPSERVQRCSCPQLEQKLFLITAVLFAMLEVEGRNSLSTISFALPARLNRPFPDNANFPLSFRRRSADLFRITAVPLKVTTLIKYEASRRRLLRLRWRLCNREEGLSACVMPDAEFHQWRCSEIRTVAHFLTSFFPVPFWKPSTANKTHVFPHVPLE